MNISEFLTIAHRYWKKEYKKHIPISPEAKVVTGLSQNDAFFHAMLVDNGVEMILEKQSLSAWSLVDYRVVDEEKFTMFALRWS